MRRLACLVLVGALAVSTGLASEPAIVESLRPFVENGNLAGAVTVVASKDRTLSVDTVGYMDVAAKTPMRPDALFWIASMNKPITATALMMLVDEGKLKLDDPVEKYLSEFRNQMVVAERGPDRLVLKKPVHPITVRNILSHTSGLVGRSPLEGKLDTLSIRVGAITYGLSPLQFEPDSKYEYCNPGINTAGRLIEVVSGENYAAFLQKRLFDPLGLKDTTFWPSEAQVSRLAKSYKPGPGGMGLEEIEITQLTYPLSDHEKRNAYPAGGLFSTARDITTFCRMILNGGELDGKRYVSENAVRAMTSTQTKELLNKGKGENGYGLGWSTSRYAKGDAGPVIPGPAGHGGAYATNMNIDPRKGLITVFMVQHQGFPGVENGKVHGAFSQAAIEAFAK